MKNIKKIIICFICFITVITLTGCQKESSHDQKEYIYAEFKNMQITPYYSHLLEWVDGKLVHDQLTITYQTQTPQEDLWDHSKVTIWGEPVSSSEDIPTHAIAGKHSIKESEFYEMSFDEAKKALKSQGYELYDYNEVK